jgi:hypothetical protein
MTANKGAASGYAPLDGSSLLPYANIPIGAAGTAGKVLAANDASTTNARTPTAHASTHESGGSDVIRLDQIGSPTSAVGLNSQKITGLANGSTSTDAATFGQIPTTVGGDLTGTLPNPTVSGTANIESIIRANTLNQMAPPTSALSMNGQRVTAGAAGTVATDFPILSQLGGWVPEAGSWTISANTTVAASSNGLTPTVATTITGSTINTTPSTVTVGSTTGFPATGTFNVVHGGANYPVTYTAIGSGTTFTGCTLASGTVTTTTGDAVQGCLNVASTTGFLASGVIVFTHAATSYILNYSFVTATAFVGVTGQSQTVSTSDMVTSNAFNISGNLTAAYTKGTRLKWVDSSTTKYGVVASSSFASSTTTVVLVPTTDYVVGNASITTPQYAYSMPPDFPAKFTWAGYVFGGFSAVPGTILGNWWAIDGGLCTVSMWPFASGTSNATTYTVAGLPIAASANVLAVCSANDNGTGTMSSALTQPSSTVLTLSKQPGATTWTASGGKSSSILITFPI